MNAVDTNVLVYFCDDRMPERREVPNRLLADLSPGVMLWQVTCEFLAAARKLAGQGFDAESAWRLVDQWLLAFPLVTPRRSVLAAARRLHLEKQVSYWDAMLLAACLDAGVTRLYSEDLPGQNIEGLNIVNPFATT